LFYKKATLVSSIHDKPLNVCWHWLTPLAKAGSGKFITWAFTVWLIILIHQILGEVLFPLTVLVEVLKGWQHSGRTD